MTYFKFYNESTKIHVYDSEWLSVLYSWQNVENVERMSGSEMWKNQIGGYSDIQKCGKKMSNGFSVEEFCHMFDTRVFPSFSFSFC